jgi:hypothetical protein
VAREVTGRQEGAVEVDRQDGAPLREGHLQGVMGGREAGVREARVNGTEALDGLREAAGHVLLARNNAREARRLGTQLAELLRCSVGLVAVPRPPQSCP